MHYTAYAQVLDWGGHVTKIVMDMGETVSSVNADDFTIDVQKIDPATGQVAMIPRSFFETPMVMIPAAGAITVQKAYPCDENGNKAASSAQVALLLNYGPPYPNTSISFSKNGFNTFADCRYTIKYKGNVVADQGKMVLAERELVETGISKAGLKFGYVKPQMENPKPPMIIWLHGAGEGGENPYIPLLGNKSIHLASPSIQSYFQGAYLFAPLCPTMWMDDGSGEYTHTGKSMYCSQLMETIREFVAAHPEIDPDRIYIGGCSNGGFMTLRMVIDFPEYFAGAFPVCEALYDDTISDEDIEHIKHLPIWFTHAKDDTVVPPDQTVVPTYQRLIAAGAKNVHFSFYEHVVDQTGQFKNPDGTPFNYFGHSSWIYALNNDCKLDFDDKPVLLNGKPTTIFEWLSVQHR